MKGFKKLLTGILAATMIMGASFTAFAAETTTNDSSITINNELEAGDNGAVKKITYTYYQFLTAETLGEVKQDGESQAIYYVENKALADALDAAKAGDVDVFTVTKAQAADKWYVKANTGVTADQIVTVLNTDDMKTLAKNAGLATGTFESNDQKTAKVDGLESGYYLVLSSLGTKAALQTIGDVVINEKNKESTVEKEDDKDIDFMFNTEDPINYTITVNVPESPAEKDIEVHDIATKGLTLDTAVTATVEGKKVGDYTWSAGVASEDGATFEYTLSIPAQTVVANAGKAIVLTYTAVINENAVVLVDEENTAYIVYDNNASAKTTPVVVRTLGINIIKVDEQNNKLTGAEFTLWDAATDGNEIKVVPATITVGDKTVAGYRMAKAEEADKATRIVVDENGEAVVVGLTGTTYYLQEEVAPAGYSLLPARESVTIDTTTALKEVTIVNKTGVTLPSTGGIGTTIFYIVGGILIVAGVAYFILRRKADAE